MKIAALDAPFGAQLLLETDHLLGPADQEWLRAAYNEHGLLVIRDGELSEERQIDLMATLGRLEPDEAGQPMRMEVTNQHAETTAPEGPLSFHYDYAYDPHPIPGISLYGSVIDGDVTPTLFANSSTLIPRLPSSLVDRLRKLRAAHACFLYSLEDPEERSVEPQPLLARGADGWGPEHYWTHHPALFETSSGHETLFLCQQHTDRLLGITRTASDSILEEVFSELYRPTQIYEHRWWPHDLVIWDNLRIQHARPEPNDQPRTLRRYHLSETDLTADYLRVARERGLV